MADNTALIVTGAVVVGGCVLGKAVVDHVFASKRAPRRADDDERDFREQHYRAAGFHKRRRTTKEDVNQVVSIVAGIAGIAYTLYQTPELIQSLKAHAE